MVEEIVTSASFTVIGQEVKLANTRSENVRISTAFWRKFNNNLKNAYLYQSGNWVKYAFTIRREDGLYYFCAIPKKNVVPVGFLEMEIAAQNFLVVEHIGRMNTIYDTYQKVYKEILPSSNCTLNQSQFLHFEKYDHHFMWNRPDSQIGIWIPIEKQIIRIAH